jgi:hypothetical protein
LASREEFCRAIAGLDLAHLDRAIALLWFYRQTQEFDERTATDLADDLRDEGFPRPNPTRLRNELRRSRATIRGRRERTFRLDLRRIADFDGRYLPLFGAVEAEVEGAILPPEWFAGTRFYLERLAHQINGAYEYGFYDACAVLARRLVESLIIETYIHRGIHQEIRPNNAFFMLDALIAHIRGHAVIVISRNAGRTMEIIKQIGDTAAHDRAYVTQQRDVDDVTLAYRRLIQELMTLAGIVRAVPQPAP